jgi:hypothetical protein
MAKALGVLMLLVFFGGLFLILACWTGLGMSGAAIVLGISALGAAWIITAAHLLS